MASKKSEYKIAMPPQPSADKAFSPQPAETARIDLADEAKLFKAHKVILICAIVVIGLILSLFFHSYQATTLGKDFYPYNTFLFNQSERFSDFSNLCPFPRHLDPYHYVGLSGMRANYFPLTYLILYPFTLIPLDIALCLFLSTFMIFTLMYVAKYLRPVLSGYKRDIAIIILSFLTYPFLFLFDRANLEIWLFISLALFVFFYMKGKDIPAILFLSIAISLKLFPAIFILLFFVDRKYTLIIYTFIATSLLTLLSASIFKGGIINTATGLIETFTKFSKVAINNSASSNLQHNTSIWAPLKLIYYNVISRSDEIPANYESIFNHYYLIFCICFFLLLTFIMVRFKLSLWKKVSLLLLTSILLQQISYDYKLINVYIPLMLFINSDEKSKFTTCYAAIFALLLIPKDYFIIIDAVSISVIINPILILSIIVMIFYEAIKKGEIIKPSYYLSFYKKALQQPVS